LTIDSGAITLNWSNQLVEMMREIAASEAKTHLPQLLDEVERGETLIITRHGRPIARLVPEHDRRREEIAAAIARIKSFQRRQNSVTVEEILSARDEGRRF
jgi:prevent-host-death family protein